MKIIFILLSTIILHKMSTQGNIIGMRVNGTGHINGKAKIILILNNKPYKTEEISGHFNFKWGGDWYSDKMEIKYKPLSVKSGKLNINYIFREI